MQKKKIICRYQIDETFTLHHTENPLLMGRAINKLTIYLFFFHFHRILNNYSSVFYTLHRQKTGPLLKADGEICTKVWLKSRSGGQELGRDGHFLLLHFPLLLFSLYPQS